jgi:hypothetical protein
MSRRKVQRIAFIGVALMLAGFIYAIARGCCIPADLISYNKFLDKVHKTMSGRGKTPYCAEQLRQGLSREISYTNGPERLKVFFTANEAELAYEGVGNDLEIIEHLKEVKSWVQEKVFTSENAPRQLVRYLEADRAFYRNAKRFICAENVQIQGYNLPGNQLTPFNSEAMNIDSSLTAQFLKINLLENTAKLEGGVSLLQKPNEKFPSSFTLSAERVSTQVMKTQTIFLEEDVKINYDNKWNVKADYGFYECEADRAKIILWSETSLCEAHSLLNKTRIRAKSIETYPKKRIIEFLKPQGIISLKEEGNQAQELEFSSAVLTWKEENEECILNNDVTVVLPNKNILLTTDKELRIKKGKQGIREIRSKGNTLLNCKNKDRGFIISCIGEVLVNDDQQLVQMQSANVSEQLLFRDDMGKVYADRAELEYQMIDQKMVPLKIVFLGNVLVLNREPPLQQRALADQLTFFFPTHELILAANSKKRVLFYDQTNNLEMSARGVKVTRCKDTKKDSIQGVGDVRFKFDEQEFAQLKPNLLPMNGSNSNSLPLEARKNKREILDLFRNYNEP